jgi:small subunit ribosomal protein S24e
MQLKTQFGGNKSEAQGFVYHSKDSLMKFEPKHRLIKQGLVEKPKVKTNRKTKKELKNKIKKLRGMEKVKAKNFGKKK